MSVESELSSQGDAALQAKLAAAQQDYTEIRTEVLGELEAPFDTESQYFINQKNPDGTVQEFQIINLKDPRLPQSADGQAVVYKGVKYAKNVPALVVDPHSPEGKTSRYKGVLPGQRPATPDVLSMRFGADVRFGVSIDEHGILKITGDGQPGIESVVKVPAKEAEALIEQSLEGNTGDDEAVQAAARLAQLEARIDEGSAHIAETAPAGRERPISDEVIDDLGGGGLEASGIKEPEPESESPVELADGPEGGEHHGRLRAVEAQYKQNSVGVYVEAEKALARTQGSLEMASNNMTTMGAQVAHQVEEVAVGLEHFLSTSSNHSVESARTLLSHAAEVIDQARVLATSLQEQTLQETEKVVQTHQETLLTTLDDARRVDGDFSAVIAEAVAKGDISEQDAQQVVQETSGATTTIEEVSRVSAVPQELIPHINGFDQLLENVSRVELPRIRDAIGTIIQDSYRSGVDIDSVAGIVRWLRDSNITGKVQQDTQKAAQLVSNYAKRIDEARRPLRPDANR